MLFFFFSAWARLTWICLPLHDLPRARSIALRASFSDLNRTKAIPVVSPTKTIDREQSKILLALQSTDSSSTSEIPSSSSKQTEKKSPFEGMDVIRLRTPFQSRTKEADSFQVFPTSQDPDAPTALYLQLFQASPRLPTHLHCHSHVIKWLSYAHIEMSEHVTRASYIVIKFKHILWMNLIMSR